MAKVDLSKLGEILECAVCLETLDETSKVLPCQHCFCWGCLHRIANTTSQLICPECRTPFKGSIDELPNNILLVRLLDTLKHAQVEQPSAFRSVKKDSLSPNRDFPVSNAFVLFEKARKKSDGSESGLANTTNVTHAVALCNHKAEDTKELSFKCNDRLLLLERVDDQWYLAQTTATRDTQRGLVQANQVRILSDDDDLSKGKGEAAQASVRKLSGCEAVSSETSVRKRSGCEAASSEKPKAAQDKHVTRKAIALNDFDESSVIISTGECDAYGGFLTFTKGESLTLFRRIDANWFVAATDSNPGRVGVCPSAYVRIIESFSPLSSPSEVNRRVRIDAEVQLFSRSRHGPAKLSPSTDPDDPIYTDAAYISVRSPDRRDDHSDSEYFSTKLKLDSPHSTLPHSNAESPSRAGYHSQSHSGRVTPLGSPRCKLGESPKSSIKIDGSKCTESDRPRTPCSAASVTFFGCGKSPVNEMGISPKVSPRRAIESDSNKSSASPRRTIELDTTKPALVSPRRVLEVESSKSTTPMSRAVESELNKFITMHREDSVGKSASQRRRDLRLMNIEQLNKRGTDSPKRGRSLTRSATERALLLAANNSLKRATTRARSVERNSIDACRRAASSNRIASIRVRSGSVRCNQENRFHSDSKSPTGKLWRTLSTGSSRFFESLKTTVKRLGHRRSVSDVEFDDEDDVIVSGDDDDDDVIIAAISPRHREIAPQLPLRSSLRSRPRPAASTGRLNALACQCINCRRRRLTQQATASPHRSAKAAALLACRSTGSNSSMHERYASEERLYTPSRRGRFATKCSVIRSFTPRGAGELQVCAGDVVFVVQVRCDGWCEALNARTNEVGFVPHVYLEATDGDESAAQK